MNPQIDHYHGRAVTEIFQDDEENHWGIGLEGDVIIRNMDDSTPAPDGIDGTVLLGSSGADGVTTMQFGLSGPTGVEVLREISLADYVIAVPDGTDPEAEETELPEDPSADRVVDGPEAQSETQEDA